MRINRIHLMVYWLFPVVSVFNLWGASYLPSTIPQKVESAQGAVVAKVVFQHATQLEGNIYTRLLCQKLEEIHGSFPEFFTIYTPGGEWGSEARSDSSSPDLRSGGTYLFFVEASSGTIHLHGGVAGVLAPENPAIEQALNASLGLPPGGNFSAFSEEPQLFAASTTSSGLLEDNGFKRFQMIDSNRSIPVKADVSTLPSGISKPQALQALTNALTAWESVSSVRFSFQGTEVFEQSAQNYVSSEGMVIRVQFHDTFHTIPDTSTTLAIGGHRYQIASGEGGTLDGVPFNPSTMGYVVMNHPKSFLQDPLHLEEVLTHELGHVLSLAHSSEDPDESDPSLVDAIMYYRAEGGSRGSQLAAYDVSVIRKPYPENDNPPSGSDRNLLVVTANSPLIYPDVNSVEIPVIDLQGDSVTFLTDPNDYDTWLGTFSVTGNIVSLEPSGLFADDDAAPGTFYVILSGKFSDGINLSPTHTVSVMQIRGDTLPSNAPDGIPDAWNQTYYGNAEGPGAAADTDLDGWTTLEEFLNGTSPVSSDPGFQISEFSNLGLTWIAQDSEAYQVLQSPSLSPPSWSTWRIFAGESGSITLPFDELPETGDGTPLFLKIQKLP